MIGGSNTLNSANVIPNNGYVTEPGSPGVIARCVTGEPPGTAGINSFLGGWFRDGSQLPIDQSCSSGSPVETHGSIVSEGYIGSQDLYRCSSSFTTSEEGVYECITVVGGPVVTETLTLNVYTSFRTSPTIDTPSPSHINTDAGVSVSLTCRSRGSVPDSFTWGQDGFSYSGTTIAETYTSSSAVYRNTYTISSAQTYHSGTWTCTVTNLIGSDSASITLQVVPDGPPRDINLTGVDPAMLSVRYSRPLIEHVNGDLTGYVIRYNRVGSSEVEVMSVVDVDNLSSLISAGLVAYVNYSIEVAATNVNGTGPFSDPVFGLSGQDVPSSAPQSLTVDDIGASYLVMSWTAPSTPNGVITQYELQYREANGTLYGGQNVSSSTNALMASLSPNALYTLNIRAYTYLGGGPFSDSVNVTTLPQAPDPVSNVTVQSRLSSSMLTVSWVEPYVPNGVINYYIVFYLPVNNTYGPIMDGMRKRQLIEDGEFTANFNESPGTLTNLNGSVTYMIQVSAVALFNGVKLIGDRSMATVGTTAEGAPSAPRALSSFNVTKADIGIAWQRPDPPNGFIIEYTVTYNVSKMYLNQSTVTMEILDDYDIMDVTATNDIIYSVDFTDLLPGTQHQFSVAAYTNVGPGDTAELSITTLPDVPPDPPTPLISDVRDITATLMIYETSNINGDILYYTIIIQRGYMGSLLHNGSTPYNEEAASVANDNGQSYGYISGVLAASNISSYPYSYELGDRSRSSYGGVEYVNVPLTANTTHVVVVRAHTADELYANSMAVEFRTNVTLNQFPQYDHGECDNGAVTAVATLLTVFVIGFTVSVMVNVFCVVQRKKVRYYVNNSEGKVKSSSNTKDEAIYEDVVYSTDGGDGATKDTIIPNPAYGTMSRVDMSQNPSYVMSEQDMKDSEYL